MTWRQQGTHISWDIGTSYIRDLLLPAAANASVAYPRLGYWWACAYITLMWHILEIDFSPELMSYWIHSPSLRLALASLNSLLQTGLCNTHKNKTLKPFRHSGERRWREEEDTLVYTYLIFSLISCPTDAFSLFFVSSWFYIYTILLCWEERRIVWHNTVTFNDVGKEGLPTFLVFSF